MIKKIYFITIVSVLCTTLSVHKPVHACAALDGAIIAVSSASSVALWQKIKANQKKIDFLSTLEERLDRKLRNGEIAGEAVFTFAKHMERSELLQEIIASSDTLGSLTAKKYLLYVGFLGTLGLSVGFIARGVNRSLRKYPKKRVRRVRRYTSSMYNDKIIETKQKEKPEKIPLTNPEKHVLTPDDNGDTAVEYNI